MSALNHVAHRSKYPSYEDPKKKNTTERGNLQVIGKNKSVRTTVTLDYEVKGNPSYEVLNIDSKMTYDNNPLDSWEVNINDDHPAPLKYKISAEGNVTYEVKGQMNLGRACLGDLCFR